MKHRGLSTHPAGLKSSPAHSLLVAVRSAEATLPSCPRVDGDTSVVACLCLLCLTTTPKSTSSRLFTLHTLLTNDHTTNTSTQEPLPPLLSPTMKTAAAAMATLLLPLAAAVSHSSSYPYTASFGARVRFPTTFLATVPSHSNAAFTTSTKHPSTRHHHQPRRVAVIRGGAAATAGASVPVPASKRGDGNKGSTVSTATFNLSTFDNA